jgi:hypothetical protein
MPVGYRLAKSDMVIGCQVAASREAGDGVRNRLEDAAPLYVLIT